MLPTRSIMSFCLAVVLMAAITLVSGFASLQTTMQRPLLSKPIIVHRRFRQYGSRANDYEVSNEEKVDSSDGVGSARSHHLMRPVILAAVVATSILVSLPTTASYAAKYEQDTAQVVTEYHSYDRTDSTLGQNHRSSAVTNVVSSSIQVSNTIESPMGELQEGSATGINPTFSKFGQWFFLLYVVVSLLAGGKEVVNRIQNQMKKDE
eukprot:g9181.t1 g9181   contig36:58982-59602(-)